MANSATVPFTLTMAEDALLKNGINGDGNIVYFDIDSDMIFNIEDIPFMLDYDIRVTSKRTLEVLHIVHTISWTM